MRKGRFSEEQLVAIIRRRIAIGGGSGQAARHQQVLTPRQLQRVQSKPTCTAAAAVFAHRPKQADYLATRRDAPMFMQLRL